MLFPVNANMSMLLIMELARIFMSRIVLENRLTGKKLAHIIIKLHMKINQSQSISILI